ncbi:hypothetical protein QYF36_009156 [Acer negundo]|nr:hypothetical protein QYF36_009156 [Acer negundo]
MGHLLLKSELPKNPLLSAIPDDNCAPNICNKLTFWFSSLAQRHGLHEALQLLLIKLFSVDCSIFIMFFGAL